MRRWQNNAHTTHQVPVYYAGNKLYKDAHARNEYPTRTSRRVHDGTSIDRNYGLDTTSDDVNSSPYSSPYYINGRYNSSNLVTQRGNSASIQGAVRLASVHDEKDDFEESDIATTIKMWQGKQIKFELPYNGKVVGNTITLKNTDGCTGILSIYFSSKDGGKPLYETSIDLCKVSEDKFEHLDVYSITAVDREANPKGKLFVRMEIWNEIDQKRSVNPFNTGRKIEIAATGASGHYVSVNTLSDKNMPVVEEYNYERLPNRPCMGLIYNNWDTNQTFRVEANTEGPTISKSGYKYRIGCINNGTEAEVVVFDKQMNKYVENTNIKIDGRVKELQFVQTKDWVYYVDGYSPVQKFQIGVWTSQALPISTSDEDTNPVVAPSLIALHNNRIYISGFRYDSNLVQFTEIVEEGPAFDSYPYRFYAPDESPLATSSNPITAMRELESNTLMIVGKTFTSLFSTDNSASGATAETAYPTQITIYTDSGGVQSSGDICNYQGVMYSFDPDEGIRRFTGSLWQKVPSSIDSVIERVDMNKPRLLWGYSKKLYLQYVDKIDGKHKTIVWDMDMNYQQYPFFQDVDMPVSDVSYDDDYDIVAMHAEYPCMMSLYPQDVWRRFDSPITFERHTKYLSLPGNATDMIVKRVHNKVLANANRWWWIGISHDKHSLTQHRGKTLTYRMPCWDTLTDEPEVEEAFNNIDIYEEDAISLLTIPNLRIRAISTQVRIKTKTFRKQASLVSTLIESAPRQYN